MLPPNSFADSNFRYGSAEHRRRKTEARAYDYAIRARHFALEFGVVTFALLLLLSPEVVIRIFTPDSELIDATALYLKSFSIDCILVCFVFCMNGFFNGCGHTTFTMANNIFCAFAVRVPATWVLSGIGRREPLHHRLRSAARLAADDSDKPLVPQEREVEDAAVADKIILIAPVLRGIV